MEKTRKMTNMIGFWKTLEILSEKRGYSTTMRIFYQEYLKISYYNSFLRVKPFLIENDIAIFENGRIKLTVKGKAILLNIIKIDDYLEDKNGKNN